MNFAYCTDNRYAVPTLVSIVSLFENNKGNECHVYVLTEGLSAEVEAKFSRLADFYEQPIKVVQVPASAFEDLKTRHRYPKSMYYRYLLPEILDIEEERVLYLDGDICVRHNLQPLFDLDLDGKACGVVEDQRMDEICHQNRLKIESTYFNSGVLLMNLDYWRKNNVKQQLIDYVQAHAERCLFPDQDALNVVLSNKVEYLSPTYNFQEQWYWEPAEQAVSLQKQAVIAQYADDPAIVHYTWNLKPWHEQCWHKHKEWFRQYGAIHPFIGFRIDKKYKPSYLSRCFAFLLRICLQGIKVSDRQMKKKNAADILSFFSIK